MTRPVSFAPSARHWLLKSEPDAFSLADLERAGRTSWDGVRNYMARNFMNEMKVGDLCLFYHSNASPPGVAGLCRVVRTAYPDPTARDPKSPYHDPRASEDNPIWTMVDVEFMERFPREVGLPELKAEPALEGMEVVRKGSRLSVQPVTPEHFARILEMACRPVPEDRKPHPGRTASAKKKKRRSPPGNARQKEKKKR